MAKWILGDNVYMGAKLPLAVVKPYRPLYEPSKHGDAVLSTIFPKSIIELKSMKYLPVIKLATSHQPTLVSYYKSRKMKREADLKPYAYVNKTSEAAGSEMGEESKNFVKMRPILIENSRQQPIVPSWSTVQYNRRPIINTPWMKDTQNVAMTTVNNINGAMLELSDTDIQRETAKANLILVQRMGDLVMAEKDKVKSELGRVKIDSERMASERDRNLMESQKLEMEKELYEAKLLSGAP
ncbi:hypothetical protein GE061_000404 [Apolygus lucorum]|uniref:Uncharacterized protein n=1 Tax=Apolygus lucorum TaxID=248454 RepID=A0A6A4KK60_APOLU|nr:hypothetical protein GE061_000404 [Apolygus lucorum]